MPFSRSISLFFFSISVAQSKCGGSNGHRKRSVQISRVEQKLGHHGSATCGLVFDRAPAELVGRRGEGFKHMLTLMNNARVGVGFECLGLSESAYRVRERYGELIEDSVTRWDVDFVIGELIAELNVSHSYRGGGDMEEPQRRGVGLLGCDFELVDGAYRIARIVDGGDWDAEVRSPLARAGVEAGRYLLAVNGVPVDPTLDPWAAFQGLAEQTVALTLNDRPDLDGAEEVLVETLGSESRLRYLEWIENARRWVDEASDGRIGYVFIPDTGLLGQRELVRQFAAQHDRPGLIFDERFNGGGQYPDRFVELMERRRSGYIAFRASPPMRWNPLSRTGAQAMLINAWAGSGGDLLPYLFRQAGLGPLIGTRTWGGLVGISGSPPLIDGGIVTLPNLALYSTDGEWLVEGHGVEPDIEVIDDPGVLARGEDPQLARAVEEVLRMLEESPPVFTDPPAYDDRTAAGLRAAATGEETADRP